MRRWLLIGALAIVALFAVQAVAAKDADAADYYEQDLLVGTASYYVGTPYSYDPYYGLTCSTFTARVYGEALGIYLPGDVTAQLYYGYAPWDLQPGDLLFYDSYLDGGIDHVALYVGDGMVMDGNICWSAVVYHSMYDIPGCVTARRIT